MTVNISKYDHLSREELIRVLEKRDGEQKLGLVWERSSLEVENHTNDAFVATSFVPELSFGVAPYRNMVIEGDNFDVLRALSVAYRGRVKCIYIDPPYNTGKKDFIYNDRFVDGKHRYRHSVWLDFMHRRLLLARDLLTEDGVIFISIGDDEHARLELLMDEVFPGRKVGTFVWRTRSGSNDATGHFLSVDHEYVLCFANAGFSFGGHKKGLTDYVNEDPLRGKWVSSDLVKPHNWKQRPDAYYPICKPDPEGEIWYPCDPARVWCRATEQRAEGKKLRAQTMEELIRDKRIDWKEEAAPAFYQTEAELMNALLNKTAPEPLQIYLGLDALRDEVDRGEAPQKLLDNIPPLTFWVGKRIGYTKPRLKRFSKELRSADQPVSTWFRAKSTTEGKDKDEAAALEELNEQSVVMMTTGYTGDGTRMLKQITGNNEFSYPKPLALIKSLIGQATTPGGDDLVLDFFAGSGTTGQAVMELNAEDDGDRSFILVSSTEATKATPKKNVCRDVTAKRLRRVISGYSYQQKVKGRPQTVEVPPVAGEFAYLRTALIPMTDLHFALSAEQTWLALQQIHGFGVSEINLKLPVQQVETEQKRLVYIPEVHRAALESLDQSLARDTKATIVYSPTPGLLAQEVFSDHVTFRKVPDAIVELFGRTV